MSLRRDMEISAFGSFGPVLGTTLTALRNPGSIKTAPYNVIAHAWQIFHPTASDEDHGVLLQIVPFPPNVSDHFFPARQANFCDFPQSGIGFFGSSGINPGTDAPALRTTFQRRYAALATLWLTRFADELIYGGHVGISTMALIRTRCQAAGGYI